jgi:hypothetical protein
MLTTLTLQTTTTVYLLLIIDDDSEVARLNISNNNSNAEGTKIVAEATKVFAEANKVLGCIDWLSGAGRVCSVLLTDTALQVLLIECTHYAPLLILDCAKKT